MQGTGVPWHFCLCQNAEHCKTASKLEKKTVNSFRYGQLYASGSGGAGRRKAASKTGDKPAATRPAAAQRPKSAAGRESGAGTRGGTAAASKSKSKVAAKIAAEATSQPSDGDPAAAAVLAELCEIYAEHVPEKTPSEVGAILAKFAGREQELLRKVKAKYCHK